MAATLDVSERTVFRAKRRYGEEGLEEALRYHNSPNPYLKVDERVEAHLIALSCSPAPEGHEHWTLRAPAGKAVGLGLVERQITFDRRRQRAMLHYIHSGRTLLTGYG